MYRILTQKTCTSCVSNSLLTAHSQECRQLECDFLPVNSESRGQRFSGFSAGCFQTQHILHFLSFTFDDATFVEFLQADEENLPRLQQHQYSYRINGRKTKGIMGRRRQMHCFMLGRPSKSRRLEERKQQMFGICT